MEFIDLKKNMNDRFDRLEVRLDGVEGRLTKLELQHEELSDKVSESFKAINTLAETNDKQHKEIMNELKGDIGVIQLSLKRMAK